MIKKEREEIQQKGSVSWNSYIAYFTAGFGYFGLIIVVLLFIAAQTMTISADYWLSIWSNLEEEYKIKTDQIKLCLENFNQSALNCNQILADISENTELSSISLIYDNRHRSYKIYLSKNYKKKFELI